MYKGLFKSDPLNMHVQFLYTTKPLWIYSSEKVHHRAVSAIAINNKFPDMIAVGYGKFLYKESDKGAICVWSAKNAKHPERVYK